MKIRFCYWKKCNRLPFLSSNFCTSCTCPSVYQPSRALPHFLRVCKGWGNSRNKNI